jgi:hypothetical protein
MRGEMKWVCVDCKKVLDETSFVDFIKESDNDKCSNQEAVVQYHEWRFMLPPSSSSSSSEKEHETVDVPWPSVL